MKATWLVGTCKECRLRIPLYDNGVYLIMASHGIFEVGPGEGNIICPASETSQFDVILNEGLIEGEQHGEAA